MVIKITPIPETDSYYGGMESKDIYLKKDNQIIGLHAIGEPNAEWDLVGLDESVTRIKGFKQWEQWGNEYDENHEMLGRGSFRIFDDIEEVAKEFEKDGWISYEGPKLNENNSQN